MRVEKMSWGRIGKDDHIDRIYKVLFEEFRSMDVPAALASNLAGRASVIFGGWDPFISTWFLHYGMSEE